MADNFTFAANGTFAFQAGAVTTISPGLPAARQANDMMIAIVELNNAAPALPTAPTGWTLLSNATANSTAAGTKITTFYYWKIANTSESAPTWTIPSQFCAAIIGCWRNTVANDSIAISVTSVNVQATSTNVTSVAVTPVANETHLIYIYTEQSGTAQTVVFPAGISQRIAARATTEGFSIYIADVACSNVAVASNTYKANTGATVTSCIGQIITLRQTSYPRTPAESMTIASDSTGRLFHGARTDGESIAIPTDSPARSYGTHTNITENIPPILPINSWSNSSSGAISTGLVINTSTGTQAKVGDIYVAFVTGFNTSTISPPDGSWSTAVSEWTFSSVDSVVFYKIVTAGDIGASYTFLTGGTSVFLSGGITCFRGVDNVNPIDAAGSGSSLSDANPVISAGSITINNNGTYLLWFGTQDSGSQSLTIPTNYVSLFNIPTSGTVEGSAGAYINQAANGATGTISGATGTISCIKQAVLVALKPKQTLPSDTDSRLAVYNRPTSENLVLITDSENRLFHGARNIGEGLPSIYHQIARSGTPANGSFTTVNNFTATMPTGLNNGDIIFMLATFDGIQSLTANGSSAWTTVTSDSTSSSHDIFLLWTIYNSITTPTTQNFTLGGSQSGLWGTFAYTGVNSSLPISSFSTSNFSGGVGATNGGAPNTIADMMVMFYAVDNNGVTFSSPALGGGLPGTPTIWFQSQGVTAQSLAIVDFLPTPNPNFGASIQYNTSNTGGSIQVSLNPALYSLTDSVTYLEGFPPITVNENVPIPTDTDTRLVHYLRPNNESIAIPTDADARLVNYQRSNNESILIPTDADSRQVNYFRTEAENIAICTDAVNAVTTGLIAVNINESIAICTDTVVRVYAGARTETESIAICTDTVARLYISGRSLAEAILIVADSVARVYVGTRTETENLGTLTDASTRLYIGHRTLTETITLLTDAVARVYAGTRTDSENLGTLTDTIVRAFIGNRSIAEAIAICTDTFSRIYTGNRSLTESIIIAADTVARLFTGHRADNENVPIPTDAVVALTTGETTISISENVPLTNDALTRLFNGSRSTIESITITDALQHQYFGQRITNETVASVLDNNSRIFAGHRTEAENLGSLTDSSNRTVNSSRLITENITATFDSIVRQIGLGISLNEISNAPFDAVLRAFVGHRTEAENTPIPSDGVLYSAGFVRFVGENIIIPIDAESRLFNALRNRTENINGPVDVVTFIVITNDRPTIGLSGRIVTVSLANNNFTIRQKNSNQIVNASVQEMDNFTIRRKNTEPIIVELNANGNFQIRKTRF